MKPLLTALIGLSGCATCKKNFKNKAVADIDGQRRELDPDATGQHPADAGQWLFKRGQFLHHIADPFLNLLAALVGVLDSAGQLLDAVLG